MKIIKSVGSLLAVTATLAFSQANTLTEAEKAAGWVLLFDGKSLHGWHKKQETVTTSSWVINDSAIHRSPTSAGNIYSPAIAESFELSVEWKLKDENGNSGIWMRMMENLTETNRSGPEIQVCGKAHPDYTRDKKSVGACYMMYHPNPAPDTWVKPAGAWNTFRVIMDGKKVQHWGNGIKVVEYEIGTPDWISRQNQAEDRIKNARYGEVHYGSFVLTDHSTAVWYRNIKVRPLAGTQIKSGFPGWDPPVSVRLRISDKRAKATGLMTESFAGLVLSVDGRRLTLRPGPGHIASGAYLLQARESK
jgi:hypothetical protein